MHREVDTHGGHQHGLLRHPLVSVMFAGRLGDLQLAAATLSGSLETLCGQGYGARAYRAMGVHLQASLLTSALASAVVSLL